MIQKYWGQPGCLCLHYIKRTNDGAPLPDSSAIFQRMKNGLCTNAYFSLMRQPLFSWVQVWDQVSNICKTRH